MGGEGNDGLGFGLVRGSKNWLSLWTSQESGLRLACGHQRRGAAARTHLPWVMYACMVRPAALPWGPWGGQARVPFSGVLLQGTNLAPWQQSYGICQPSFLVQLLFASKIKWGTPALSLLPIPLLSSFNS